MRTYQRWRCVPESHANAVSCGTAAVRQPPSSAKQHSREAFCHSDFSRQILIVHAFDPASHAGYRPRGLSRRCSPVCSLPNSVQILAEQFAALADYLGAIGIKA